MHIYKELFYDDICRKKRKRILRKIKYHAGLTSVYVIVLSEGPDYFDLLPGYVLKQKAYPVARMHIMGLADGYDSAVALVTDMIDAFSKKYGTIRFKDFILREKELNFTGYNRK